MGKQHRAVYFDIPLRRNAGLGLQAIIDAEERREVNCTRAARRQPARLPHARASVLEVRRQLRRTSLRNYLLVDFYDLSRFRFHDDTAVIHDGILVLRVLRDRPHLHSGWQG